MVNELPYEETSIGSHLNEKVIRKFRTDVHSDELKWHWDEEERIVHPVHETDWLIQLDNKLPQRIDSKVVIPKGMWHRLIKGSGDLELMIEKIKDI